jgi:MFS family permease
VADGVAFSMMVGAGETYIPAFVLALGLSQLTAGLVSAVPMLIGATLQLISPWAVRRLGSCRRWIVLCARGQAATLLLLPLAILLPRPAPFVFAVASLYWATGLATSPAWNTWMQRIVPVRIRPRYFGIRSRLMQMGTVAGLLGAGWTLQLGAAYDMRLWTFTGVFLVAGTFRLASAWFLSRQIEPAGALPIARNVPVREMLRRMVRGSDGGLISFLIAMQVSVQIAGPYFSPYMLGQLQFRYLEYVCLLCTAYVGKVLAMPYASRFAVRYGALRLLWIGGLGITPIGVGWLVSNKFAYLIGLQLAGGAAWAAYELAMLLMFFETIPEEERTSVLTMYNWANAAALACGAALGGLALHGLGTAATTYATLFALSTGARFTSLALLLRVPVPRQRFEPMATRTIAVRPSAGSIERPVLPSISRSVDEASTGSGR